MATIYLYPGRSIHPSTHPPTDLSTPTPLTEIQNSIRNAKKPITPFNWEIEFPEVFDRENPGFDAIVGNPPFAGKNTIISGHPEGYLDWLKELHPESHGNADLVAHFFRRAFNVIRKGGTYGLISTNTVAQGDTRITGLQFICINGGVIYDAKKRVKWPGLAAVVISIISIFKGNYEGAKLLDEKKVPVISAFLFHTGGNKAPMSLLSNKSKAFQGTNVVGQGFTFDDQGLSGGASSLLDMEDLIAKDSKNSERIFPYIGGQEINESPTQSPKRYIIDFGEMHEEEARNWPDLINVLKEKVLPFRLAQNRESYKRFWWRHGERRVELYSKLKDLKITLACSQTSKYLALAFFPANIIFSTKAVVFIFESFASFGMLQSRLHEYWMQFLGSSMKDDPVYTPSDCFETFPFPENWETDPTLEAIGKTYYDYRADLMVRNNQGLTDTYNRFHDPTETHPDIRHLRHLHEQMDRAVLAAYSWPDIDTTCGFALDYLDTDPDDLPPEAAERVASGDLFFATPDEAAAFGALISTGKRKLPWRYKWPEATHDEVLARLLDLNQQRHLEEVRGHKAPAPKAEGKKQKRAKAKPETPTIPGMEV